MSSTQNSTVPRSLEDRLGTFAEAWKPSKGDKLIGVVIDIDMRESDYGEPYPIVTVERDDGTEVAFHGFHTVARRELKKKQPQVGDRIGIGYHGRGEAAKAGMSGAELYKIIIQREEKPTVDWSAVPDDEETDSETRAKLTEWEEAGDDIPF